MITKNTTVNTSAGATCGREEAAPGGALAERVEPEEVGVEAGEPAQAEQQDDEDDDDPDDPAAEAETGTTPGLDGRDAHRARSLEGAVLGWRAGDGLDGRQRLGRRVDHEEAAAARVRGRVRLPGGEVAALHRGFERVVVAVGALARRPRAPSAGARRRVPRRTRPRDQATAIASPSAPSSGSPRHSR